MFVSISPLFSDILFFPYFHSYNSSAKSPSLKYDNIYKHRSAGDDQEEEKQHEHNPHNKSQNNTNYSQQRNKSSNPPRESLKGIFRTVSVGGEDSVGSVSGSGKDPSSKGRGSSDMYDV